MTPPGLLRGSILQDETCLILRLAENPRWSPGVAKTKTGMIIILSYSTQSWGRVILDLRWLQLAGNQSKPFSSSGRMFLLSDMKTVQSGLDKKRFGYKEKIHILNAKKEYLEKQIKEQENALRELIINHYREER